MFDLFSTADARRMQNAVDIAISARYQTICSPADVCSDKQRKHLRQFAAIS
jgi:hypothetical protein